MSDFDSRAKSAADAVRSQLGDANKGADLKRVRRSRTPRGAVAGLAALALVAGTSYVAGSAGNDTVKLGPGGASFALAGQLSAFDECDAALDYFKLHGQEYLQSGNGGRHWALEAPQTASTIAGSENRTALSADQTALSPESATGAAPAYSKTNVQEAGVDEPDLIKTDGRRVVAINRAGLHVLEIEDGKLKLRATIGTSVDPAPSLQPGSDPRQPMMERASANILSVDLLLTGNRVLVFGNDNAAAMTGNRPRAHLTLFDISDVASPRLMQSLTVDGNIVDSRMTGSRVRVVTNASPDFDILSPSYGPGGSVDQRSTDRLRKAIESSTLADWTPAYELRDGAGKLVSEGPAVGCQQLSRPAEFSGLATVAVTSFDINAGLMPERSVGVIGGGQTVYATPTTLYVSTTRWDPNRGQAMQTNVHKFATIGLDPVYRGSGDVRGTLLSQYAMSEHENVLRVASTVNEQRGWVNGRNVIEGMVTTLREDEGRLIEMGSVAGLGRDDNESIRGVRFIGKKGYVVTFRQTDPLFVIDLADPAKPFVAGELKIPGYSGYLHPVGEDLLLGVGQSGTDVPMPGPLVDPMPRVPVKPVEPGAAGSWGGVAPEPNPPATSRPLPQANGVQFSLFDVSNPADPRRTDVETYGPGQALAETNPRAFLYWEPLNLIVAPVLIQGGPNGTASAAVVLKVEGKSLTRAGQLNAEIALSQYGDIGGIQRNFIIGDSVYSFTTDAVLVDDVNTLQRRDQVALGGSMKK